MKQSKKVSHVLIAVVLAAVLLVWFYTATHTSGVVMGELMEQFPLEEVKLEKIDLRTEAVQAEQVLTEDQVHQLAEFIRGRKFRKIFFGKTAFSSEQGYRITAKDDKNVICIQITVYGNELIAGYVMDPEGGGFRLRNQQDGWMAFLDGMMQ